MSDRRLDDMRARIGERIGQWTIVGAGRYAPTTVGSGKERTGRSYYVLRCSECGAEVHRDRDMVRRSECRGCHRLDEVAAIELVRLDRGLPRLDETTRFEDDLDARTLVVMNGAMGPRAIGACFGITGERARQIVEAALKSLGRSLQKAMTSGALDPTDVAEIIRGLADGVPRHALEEIAEEGDPDGGAGSRGTQWTNPPAERVVEERWDSEHGQRVDAALARLEVELEIEAAMLTLAESIAAREAA